MSDTKDVVQVSIIDSKPMLYDEALVARAEKCRERLEEAYRRINDSFYDFAVALYEARVNDYFKVWGCTFEEYAERLGLKRRVAYYFLNCGRLIKEYNISKDRAIAIGWTKLALLGSTGNVSPDDADKLLHIAESTTFRGLKQYLDSRTVDKPVLETPTQEETQEKEPEVQPERVFYVRQKFNGEAANIVENALEMAKTELETDSVSEAFLHICSEWLLYRKVDNVQLTLDSWREYLEFLYGKGVTIMFQSEPDMDEDIDEVVSEDNESEESDIDKEFENDAEDDISKEDVEESVDIDIRNLL